MKLEFSRGIFEKYWNFMKTRPVGAEGPCGRKDMTVMAAFRNFANAPKNYVLGVYSANTTGRH